MSMFSFDTYNQSEIPNIYLANPDGTPLYNLGTIYNRKFEMRYNTLSTFTFTAPSKVDGTDTDYYRLLQKLRLVYVENIGVFSITEVSIENDGIIETKEITCKSLEVTISNKKLSLFGNGDAYTFNNTVLYTSGSGVAYTKNLMTELLAYIPDWTLGTVSGSTLANTTRTFDVTDKTLYDFMVNEVSQTFQCVFIFDSINKTISAYPIADATTPTDIFISFDNLMKSFTIEESTDELATALTVLGGEGLDISLVNPLGTTTMYNFDYYKTTDWMTQDMIDGLDTWEGLVNLWQPSYSASLTDMQEENTILVQAESQVSILEGELAALVTARDAMVEQGLDVTAKNAEIAAKEAEIEAQNTIIETQEIIVSTISGSLSAVNDLLSFENNFTTDEIKVLNNYIIGNTYTNTNFIQTSEMSIADIQGWAQELYDQAVLILEKISQPRYTFDIDTANFAFLKEYEHFVNQLSLGSVITVELSTTTSTSPVLLGIDFNYDDPEDFKMILSNRLRLDDNEFQYNDLFGSIVDSATTTNFNSQKWNSSSTSYSNLISGGNNVVVSSTLSNTNNIPIFTDTSGKIIKDVGAIYTPPTSFTPTATCGDATFTHDTQLGYYTVLGRMLFFQVYLAINRSGTGSQALGVNLPSILSKNITNMIVPFIPICQGITLDSGYSGFCFYLSANSRTAYLYQQKTADNIAIVPADNFTSASIALSGCYLIN